LDFLADFDKKEYVEKGDQEYSNIAGGKVTPECKFGKG
jgi:hypothetical protein